MADDCRHLPAVSAEPLVMLKLTADELAMLVNGIDSRLMMLGAAYVDEQHRLLALRARLRDAVEG